MPHRRKCRPDPSTLSADKQAVLKALSERKGRTSADLQELTGLSHAKVNYAAYHLRRVGWAQSTYQDGNHQILVHFKQTSGPAQGQKGLQHYKHRRNGNGKAVEAQPVKPATEGTLADRINSTIDSLEGNLATLKALTAEASGVLRVAEEFRARLQ